jgi:dihydrofolate reductase
MGKLIYSLNVTLDGYVATVDGGLDWASIDDELHTWFNDQTRTLAASLYGRRMYQLMSGYWPTAESDPAATEPMRDFARIWANLPKIVFSTTLDSVDWNSRLVAGDVRARLAELRTEFHGDLDVSGPTLASEFLRHGLVDEYRLIVHPVVLGSGIPLFPDLAHPVRLRLIETRTFGSGVVCLGYSARER